MQKQKIIIILGPTATGKSALAIAIAKKYDGEIISADSRQVYQGLDLGTGKVTKKEMSGIPHYLLDVADPKKQFSVAEYAKLAKAAIDEITSRGKLPIICGGTGFYIDALASGVVLPEVPANAVLRKKLAELPLETLMKQLRKLDPKRAQTVDANNKVRIIRAIEIATAIGKVPAIKKKDSPYAILKIGLDMPDEILKEKIAIRLKERIKKGMLREATQLHEKGLSWKRMRELGLEYRAMADFLAGETIRRQFEQNLAMDTWHYAKRQRTWFKRDKTIVWIDPRKKAALRAADTEVKNFLG